MKILINEKLSEHKYKTPEGYLICVDSILARTGKQTYRRDEVFHDNDETEIEIDRTPNEVFSNATIASFENKPITVEHPDEDVNAENYKEYAVGFVRDVKKGSIDGQDVLLGTLVITDAQTIEEIENGEHTDLSCGYDCDIIDETNPCQRNIRGNHVALCQEGRAGIARIVDSINDKLIDSDSKEYRLNIKQLSDRDASKLIGIAQNLGFTTDDRGYELILKAGNERMFMNLKRQISGIKGIEFMDSIKDNKSDALRQIEKILSENVTEDHEGLEYLTTYGYAEIEKIAKAAGLTYTDLKTTSKGYMFGKGGMQYAILDREVRDNVELKVSHDNFREPAVYVLQSDVDKNLYFYIGKTHAVKDGEFTYTQYKIERGTPEEILNELKHNGWHQVTRGPLPFLDACRDEYNEENKEHEIKDEQHLYYVEFKLDGKSHWTNIKADSEENAKRRLINSFSNAEDIRISLNDAKYSGVINVNDSINDSLASDVYSELKKQFPDIQIKMQSRPNATPHAFLKCTDFYLSASNSKLDNIMKFCQHLTKKYNGDRVNIYVNESSHRLTLMEYTGIDSKTQAAVSEYVKHVEKAVHAAYPKVDVKTKTEASVKGLYLTLEFLNTSSYPNCLEKIQNSISSRFAKRIPNGKILQTEVDELQRLAKTPLRFNDSTHDSSNYRIIVNGIERATWEANSPEEAVKEFLEYNPAYKNKGHVEARVKDSKLDKALNIVKVIKAKDASKHEVVVYAENILSEMGKNNSTGKYDRVVFGAASLLGEGFLTGDKLKEATRREVERLLKKYNL